MRFVRLTANRLAPLAAAYGGDVHGLDDVDLTRFVPLDAAHAGDLAPLLRRRYLPEAFAALRRGATLLVSADLAAEGGLKDAAGATLWVHPFATWAMAKVLAAHAMVVDAEARGRGSSVTLGPNVTVADGVTLGDRVTLGASSVLGGPGFGWATGPGGEQVHVPQLGGVVVEDDVWVGPLVTVDAGTLAPTILRRGVKLDAQVHVGHNTEIGEGTVVAAQSGFAGSVRIGRRVLIGGQVGIADHVTVGDDARIAAKSGVIGDVPAGVTVGGYPAVPRMKWLRGQAALYRRER